MILRARDIDTLVLFGIATSGVVLSTLLEASDADCRLVLVKDCCTDERQPPRADRRRCLAGNGLSGSARSVATRSRTPRTGTRACACGCRITSKEFVPPHDYLLSFDIREPEDLDAEFRRLLREAYHLGGLQEYLKLRIKN